MSQPAYPLATERLLLRPFDDGDFDTLMTIEGNAEVARYLYWDPRSGDEVRTALEMRKAMTGLEQPGDALRLAAVLKSTGELVGDISVRWLQGADRQGEIGFIVHPDHVGRGYATEASIELLRIAFEEARLHRICGRCDARNTASARLMERLGMRREGHLRENEFVKGEWTDELIYAMLASEWQARR